ncbi:MAG: CHAP domain-containing protein [Nocardioides sp.]
MQHGRHRAPTRPRVARRGVVLVLSLAIAMTLGLSSADAEPGQGKGKPGAAAGPGQPGVKPGQAGEKGGPADEAEEPEEPVGSPGTIAANAGYGYAWPLAPDCDESPATNGGCVDDGRGFFQGQCTSWVAHRLSQLNGISFTNWYEGRHWGDADQWADVAKSIKIKPDETPSPGDVAWYARGHVAYVESVNPDGSIMISEMNFDGHNGFRMITVYPGPSWPDKFIHLADNVPGASTVVPVDTTAPTAPTGLRVASHRGRIGVDWQPSSDEWGVAGYRVSRSGAPLATVPADSTTYWDHQVSAGQAYSYTVVAYDDAGNVSAPATVDVGQPAEAADGAWVPTDAGPALCGRTRALGEERLGCTVLTRKGWRFAGLGRDTNWGRPGTRSFVASEDGGVAYCRKVGAGTARGVACTTLDPDTLTWGYDRIAGPLDQTLEEDRTWVSTGEGPALCGRTGSPAHMRVGCTVLTDAGWTFVGLDRDTAWGQPGSRAFLSADDGTVHYCRRFAGAGDRLLASCTPFDPATLVWGYDRISHTPEPTVDVNRTWVTTGAGPALCGRTGTERDQGLGCSVLTDAGWSFTGRRDLAWGDPASRAFVRSGANGVSYCRTLPGPAGDRAACTRFDAARSTWGRNRVAEAVEPTLDDSRTWQETASGPALCGRAGNETNQRLACTVLTRGGWAIAGLGRNTTWGDPGTFVPAGEGGLAYCRSITPPARAGRVACTAFDAASRVWRRDKFSGPARLTLSDPF